MTLSIRKIAAPALLAAALVPLAFTAQAGPHDGKDREQMREHMQEQRDQVYQRAELSEEKQQELNEATEAFFDAMKELREDHEERVGEILTDEEQEAIKEAMREVREEHRAERGERRRGHGDNDSDDSEDPITTQ